MPGPRDPLAGSSWSEPSTVAAFVRSAPNQALLRFARDERMRVPRGLLLDLGCGAGRNAVPLAREGWDVLGTDLSWPMLRAAAARIEEERLGDRIGLVRAPMDLLPVRDQAVDLLVAHGIWNLARSAAEFRRALAEAARVVRPQAGLFVFTFSRNTLPPDARPVVGEPFVFTEFSGQPQCFLTEGQLTSELAAVGFTGDPAVRLTEHNRQGRTARRGGPPVIYEGAYRRAAV